MFQPKPWITSDDKAAVMRVLDSGDLMGGKEVAAFEEELADYFGKRHAVCVSSGTAALECAFAATGSGTHLQPGRFIALESAAIAVHGKFETSDVGVGTDVLGKWSQVHGRVHDCAHRFSRDACRADVSCFSFNANKFIACVGGCLVTDDGVVAAFAKQYRNHGRDGDKSFRPGRHLRMGEVNAALGRSQLKRIDDILGKRDEVRGLYKQHYKLEYGDGRFLYAITSPCPRFRSMGKSFGIWNGGSDYDLLPVFPNMTATDVREVVEKCAS